MKSRRRVAEPVRAAGAPFLHRITSLPEKIDQTKYPFNIRAFSQGIDLAFRIAYTKGGPPDPLRQFERFPNNAPAMAQRARHVNISLDIVVYTRILNGVPNKI